MFLDNDVLILTVVIIVVLVANIVFLELGKAYNTKKQSKFGGANAPMVRKNHSLSLAFYMTAIVIDIVFIIWVMTTGKDIIDKFVDLGFLGSIFR